MFVGSDIVYTLLLCLKIKNEQKIIVNDIVGITINFADISGRISAVNATTFNEIT